MKTIYKQVRGLLLLMGFILVANLSHGQTPKLLIESNFVATHAGSTIGLTNGAALSAQFSLCTGVAADTFGNLFVADYNNHVIRKITSSGVVSTFAGTGTIGFLDGLGSVAMFNSPTGIATDLAGNIYVADQFNNRIRKITQSGVVSTFAGDGFYGAIDGVGSVARFNFPTGLALDNNGNVYVADQYNHRIRKITPAGFVSTLAGSGTAGFVDGVSSVALFNLPTGIATDQSGNVYVADNLNNCIRKLTPTGFTTTIAGTGLSGYKDTSALYSMFSTPTGLFVDTSNTIYVADKGNYCIRKITSKGLVSTYSGNGLWGNIDGSSVAAKFANPYSIIQDKNGVIFVADASNNRIKRLVSPGFTPFSTSKLLASSSQNITFSGRDLITGIEVVAPNGFEVSTDPDYNYQDSLAISPTNGEFYRTIYIRLKANNVAGTYSGNLLCKSFGAATQSAFVTGIVSCLTTTIYPISLGSGAVGYTYSQNLGQTGLGTPTWSVISGSLPPGLTLRSDSGFITGLPTTVGNFGFTVQATEGICQQTRTYSISISGIPTARFVYSGINCTNRNVQFKDSSILASSWTWDFGDGSFSNLQNPFHTFPKDSIYHIKLIINGNQASTINTISIATFPQIPALTAVPTCNYVYTFAGAPNAYGYSYSWGFDPGSVGSADNIQTPFRYYPSGGLTNVTLTIVAQGKCMSTASPLSFNASPKTVGVQAGLVVNLLGGNACSNSRVISNTSTGSGNVFSYNIDGGPFVPIVSTAILNSLSNGYHIVRLAAHDSSCFDTTSSSFIVSDAIASFNATPSICNQTVSFGNTSLVYADSASYLWVFGSPVKGSSTLRNPVFNFGVPGRDTAYLTVTASSGCVKTTKQSFVVGSVLGPTPNFSMSNAGTCKNQIQFTNTTTNTSGVSYLWDFGDGTQSSQTNPVRGYGDTGYFNVTLNVIKPGCNVSINKNVYIPDSVFGPSARFTINNSVQPITTNSFNFFNNSKFLNSSKGYNTTYYWSFGDGTMDSFYNSVYAKKYSLAGTYTVTLAAKSNIGCTDLFSQTVVVSQVLTSRFSYTPNSCSNRAVQFHDSSTLASSYLWDFGDGNTSTLANPTHVYVRDSVYLVRLTVNGTEVSLPQYVTVSTTPFMGSLSSTSNCKNEYTFYGAPSGLGLTYLWTFAAGSIGGDSTVQVPTRAYFNAGTTTVSLMVSSYGRCSASPTPLVFTPLLYTNAIQAGISLSAPAGNLCSNSRVLNNTSIPNTNTKYSLDNGPYTSIGTSTTLSNLGIGFHWIRMVATNGSCFDTAYKEFYISNPTVSFISTPSTCNQVVSFDNNSTANDNGNLTYLWQFGFPLKGTSTEESPSFDFVTPGKDSVTLFVSSSSGCTLSSKQVFTVGSGTTTLKAGFIFAPVPGMCENRYQFVDTTKGGAHFTNWDFNDGSNSTFANPIKSFGDTGYFLVTLTSNIGNCVSVAKHPVYISPLVYGPFAAFTPNQSTQNLSVNSFVFNNLSKNLNAGWLQKYFWRFGDGTVDSVHTTFVGKTYSNPGTYQVTLIVYSSTGCIDSTHETVTVLPEPIAKYGVILNSCTNRQVVFRDSSTLASSYFWNFGDGFTSTLANPVHSYASDGNYLVSLTINGNLTTSKTILVVSNPSAAYTITSNNCSNQFRFQAADIGSTYKYIWRFSNGTPNDTTIANPVVSFTNTDSTRVNLFVISGDKCFTNALQDTIYPQIGVKASVAISSSDYCGANRLVTNNGLGGSSFLISLDGSAFTAYTAPVAYTNLGWGNHQLLFVADNGSCKDTLSQVFKVNNFTGNFTSRSNNCNQSVEFFSNLKSSDDSPLSYLWSFAGEGTSTEMNPLFVFSSIGKRKVTLVASSSSGCVKNYSDSVQVNSASGPISTFTTSEIKTSPCQTGFNFVSTSPNGVQFYWSFGDGLVSNQSVNKAAFHSYTDTGFYRCTMVAINGLGCSTVSDTAIIHVTTPGKPSPIAFFGVNDSVQCLSYQNFTFINSSTLDGVGWISKFRWTMGDGKIDTISNSVYGKRYDAIGLYTVNLTATTNLGCSHVYSRTVRVVSDNVCNPLGLNQNLATNSSVDLYPNPNNGKFTFMLKGVAAKNQTMRIIDMLGREMWKGQLQENETNMEVDLAAGKYYLEIIFVDGQSLRKSFVVVD